MDGQASGVSDDSFPQYTHMVNPLDHSESRSHSSIYSLGCMNLRMQMEIVTSSEEGKLISVLRILLRQIYLQLMIQ